MTPRAHSATRSVLGGLREAADERDHAPDLFFVPGLIGTRTEGGHRRFPTSTREDLVEELAVGPREYVRRVRQVLGRKRLLQEIAVRVSGR